ncbi:MAG: DNA-3-methyladenine glycosylase [Acidobacteriales bacterium]|nr:DNA-3-methyladenine glycosylase [Terriglobales bacterium]
MPPKVTPLPRSFYERDPVIVAQELLGKLLVRRDGKRVRSGIIVETEAYIKDDPAAHAYRGITERNRVLFGPAGHAYVYSIYGMHYCLNFSCMREGEAGCTLIRALEPVAGIEAMQRARGVTADRQLASGPGKLCDALDITRAQHNGADVCDPRSELLVTHAPPATPFEIGITPRIGINPANPALDWPLRFVVRGSRYLSRPLR